MNNLLKTGNRKFLAFILTVLLFTLVVIIALVKLPNLDVNMPVFVFQLATAYAVICGLFFGSNVLEHFANKPVPAELNTPMATMATAAKQKTAAVE